jgi:hypothetical protein
MTLLSLLSLAACDPTAGVSCAVPELLNAVSCQLGKQLGGSGAFEAGAFVETADGGPNAPATAVSVVGFIGAGQVTLVYPLGTLSSGPIPSGEGACGGRSGQFWENCQPSGFTAQETVLDGGSAVGQFFDVELTNIVVTPVDAGSFSLPDTRLTFVVGPPPT